MSDLKDSFENYYDLSVEERVRKEAVRNGLTRFPRIRKAQVPEGSPKEFLAVWPHRFKPERPPFAAGQGPSVDHALDAVYAHLRRRFQVA